MEGCLMKRTTTRSIVCGLSQVSCSHSVLSCTSAPGQYKLSSTPSFAALGGYLAASGVTEAVAMAFWARLEIDPTPSTAPLNGAMQPTSTEVLLCLAASF